MSTGGFTGLICACVRRAQALAEERALGGHGAVNQKGSRAEIDTENGEEEEEEEEEEEDDTTMMVAKCAVGLSFRTHALHKGKAGGTSQTFEEALSRLIRGRANFQRIHIRMKKYV